MGISPVNIDLSDSALAYLEQRFLKLFGRDAETQELREWFTGLQKTALVQTKFVQCLGMIEPVPFESIYQPTRLIVGASPDETPNVDFFAFDAHLDKHGRRANQLSRSIVRGRVFNEKTISVDEFLKRDHDALIFSGPGWGKTTLMHHIFRSSVHKEDLLPLLITLRRPTAIDDLERYVEASSHIKNKKGACTLLLVDGYDEVSKQQQQKVSEALLRFQSKQVGKFYLTCREYYEVAGLKAPQVRIDAFNQQDQIKFVDVFLSAYGCNQNAVTVVSRFGETWL